MVVQLKLRKMKNPNINKSEDYGWVFFVFIALTALISYLCY